MTDPDNAPEPEVVPAGRSKLDELRAAFQQKVADPRLYKKFPAPGEGPFAGRIAGEYRVLDSKESADALAAKDEFGQNADTLIRSLVQIHIQDDEHPAANDRGLVPLHTWLELDTGELKFDTRLVETLNLTVDDTKARTIALTLFEGNEIALGAHAAQVLAWMTNTRTEAFQDFQKGS